MENLDAYLPFFTRRLDAQSPQSLGKDPIKDPKKKGTPLLLFLYLIQGIPHMCNSSNVVSTYTFFVSYITCKWEDLNCITSIVLSMQTPFSNPQNSHRARTIKSKKSG